MMNEDKWTDYIFRYSQKELSEEECRELESWILSDDENKKEFNRWMKVYRKSRRVGCWNAVDEAGAWDKIDARISTKRQVRNLWIKKWWTYAALFIILVGSGTLVYQLQDENDILGGEEVITYGQRKAILVLSDGNEINLDGSQSSIQLEDEGSTISLSDANRLEYERQKPQAAHAPSYNTIYVPQGGEYSLILSDGTEVFLNSESELVFPVNFAGGERVVKLKGEGFFKVKKDTRHPFVVESAYNRVEVLGTQFNISAYEGELIKTTLLQGSVKVSNGQDLEILKPGEQSVASHDLLEIKEVDAKVAASWIHGIFEFEDMKLTDILKQLQRWYGIEYSFVRPELGDLIFTGAVNRYRELDFVLDILSDLSDVHFDRKGKTVTIY